MIDYYDDYICLYLYIFKYERGGGKIFDFSDEIKRFYKKQGIFFFKKVDYFKDYQLVGCYDIMNVFLYNIGLMNFNSGFVQLLKFDVGFYYERYRFYGQKLLDDDGRVFYFNNGVFDDFVFFFLEFLIIGGSSILLFFFFGNIVL